MKVIHLTSSIFTNHPLQKRDLPTLEEDSYELCFNAACALSNKGNFNEAEKKLKVCEKMCRESLEDDGMSEEEMQDEIAVIR